MIDKQHESDDVGAVNDCCMSPPVSGSQTPGHLGSSMQMRVGVFHAYLIWNGFRFSGWWLRGFTSSAHVPMVSADLGHVFILGIQWYSACKLLLSDSKCAQFVGSAFVVNMLFLLLKA